MYGTCTCDDNFTVAMYLVNIHVNTWIHWLYMYNYNIQATLFTPVDPPLANQSFTGLNLFTIFITFAIYIDTNVLHVD